MSNQSRDYFYERCVHMTTDDIVDIIIQIDNGLYDEYLESREWFGKLNILREELIEILLKRYREYYLFADRKNNSLDRAYNTYLKHYIKMII
jgi:hypothetical protein